MRIIAGERGTGFRGCAEVILGGRFLGTISSAAVERTGGTAGVNVFGEAYSEDNPRFFTIPKGDATVFARSESIF